ncbi:hypothetical protein [Paraliobacillus zengyii]|uniref:hypothetical protein n=1 Tax=Paraliobacillus zengyii TaxID=2213194 RepID=UPI000E3DFDA8|nr:hypothetical protein [Paraliobacillus zengyii]
MNTTELFVNYMEKTHEIKVNINEVIFEGLTMFQAEIDENIFPVKVLKGLPDPLLFLTTVYMDQKEQEWIFCIVTEIDIADKWLHAVCIKDGELIDENVPLVLRSVDGGI